LKGEAHGRSGASRAGRAGGGSREGGSQTSHVARGGGGIHCHFADPPVRECVVGHETPREAALRDESSFRSSDRRTRIMATDPSAAACRVRGLDTPCATSTTDPPGARSAGASLGFALQGVPLERERCPSRGVRVGGIAGRRLSATRCSLSWGSAALRGLEPAGPGRLLVSVRPGGVSTPLGWSSCGPGCTAEAELRPSMRFRAPSETCPCSPAPQRRRPVRRPTTRPGPRCCLSWGSVPYDTVSDRRIRIHGGGSLHHRVPRARFGYLLRGLHHRSYRRARRRSVHGLRPARLSPRRERYPSRGPCPPDVAADPTPEGCGMRAAAYRASFPRRVRAATESPEGKTAVDAFLGFSSPELSPHPPGRSLVVTMPALSPLGGMTSLPTWASGLRGSDGSAWSVSGLPALLRFRTS
jgi:hypothetical protein